MLGVIVAFCASLLLLFLVAPLARLVASAGREGIVALFGDAELRGSLLLTAGAITSTVGCRNMWSADILKLNWYATSPTTSSDTCANHFVIPCERQVGSAPMAIIAPNSTRNGQRQP